MTDANYTAIAMLNDRSGSMQGIKDDAEGAINAFVAEQQNVPGKCTLRMMDFATDYNLVHGSLPIIEVPQYKLRPAGGTALLDALGRLIVDFGDELSAIPEEQRPGKVIVVVQTDGKENSSKDWTKKAVFDLVTRQREVYNWEFVYLGANQDVIKEGTEMGFAAGSSLAYNASPEGMAAAARTMSGYVARYRGGESTSFSDQERAKAMQL